MNISGFRVSANRLRRLSHPGMTVWQAAEESRLLFRRKNPHARFDPGPVARARKTQVIRRLQVHPEFGRSAEVLCQPQGDRSGDGRAAMNDVVDTGRVDIDVARQPVLADRVRPHEFLKQDFAGRDREKPFCCGHRRSPLVIVHDLDQVRAVVAPFKTDPPLIVDAD